MYDVAVVIIDVGGGGGSTDGGDGGGDSVFVRDSVRRCYVS